MVFKKFYTHPGVNIRNLLFSRYAIMKIIFSCFFTLHVGRKSVHLEISGGEKNMAGLKSAKRSLSSSILELKLDELRKELSSTQGGIFPHSILSTQQISMISAQKPNSMKQAGFIVTGVH